MNYFEAKQHWESQKRGRESPKIDFEWKTLWSQTTLGTIKVKGTT